MIENTIIKFVQYTNIFKDSHFVHAIFEQNFIYNLEICRKPSDYRF